MMELADDPEKVGAASRSTPAWARVWLSASRGLLSVERWLIMAFMALLCVLILVNITTRYMGAPIYWIDESAIYSVVWLTFIGASAMTRLRLDFAVTMLTEKLSPRGQVLARRIATLGVVAFALMLLWMCWLWFDPVGIAAAGFDARAYAGASFNFIYTERTQTLSWPSWVLYLIIPIFGLSMLVHALANLVEDFGLSERSAYAGFSFAQADGIN
ncbi:MAG: TRAP transporter small permease [Bosea sp. (in: a-proteobacteria)]